MAEPFHFLTDPIAASQFVQELGSSVTESIVSGTIFDIVSSTQIVAYARVGITGLATLDMQARMNYGSGSTEFGIYSHFTPPKTDSYCFLYFAAGSRWSIFQVIGNVATELGFFSEAVSPGSFQNIRAQVVSAGPVDQLTLSRNGTVVVGPVFSSTAINPSGSTHGLYHGGSGQIDWYTRDMNFGLTSVSPVLGLGSTALALVGTDFGDGMLVELDGAPAVPVVTTSTTSATAVAPAHAKGAVDVDVKFGTAGSEEFTATLTAGYEYTSVEPANVTVRNQRGDLVQGVKVSAVDANNAVIDSDVSDANGKLTLSLEGSLAGVPHRLIPTKTSVAGGNSQLELVTNG